ncbi:MAG: HD domain-containing phosphohydrolase [Desulfoplanes sp.]
MEKDYPIQNAVGIRRKRILVVDDEIINCQLIKGIIETFGYEVIIATGGAMALDLLDTSFDLALLDVLMPEMDGLTLVRKIRERSDIRHIPIIMVTGLANKKCRLEAVEAGANDFVSKPIDTTELHVRMRSLLKMKEALDGIKEYQVRLEEMVRVRTRTLISTVESLSLARRTTQEAHRKTIRCLAMAAEYRNVGVANHILRMSEYSALIARNLGLPDNEVEMILEASPMHDIGKIGIADAILLKPGKLSPSEWGEMKEHACIGAHILEASSSELIQTGSLIAMTHHEKWDGSGYPRGISGKNIPLLGRICAVADVFDALTTARPYKKAFSVKDALTIMHAVRGKHFDVRVFDAFTHGMKEVRFIYQCYQKKAGHRIPTGNC